MLITGLRSSGRSPTFVIDFMDFHSSRLTMTAALGSRSHMNVTKQSSQESVLISGHDSQSIERYFLLMFPQ